MNTRSTDDGPFCWQSKEALKLIHDHFSETNNLPSAIAVYVALSVIASNKQNATFTAKRSDITSRAGVGARTLDLVLARLGTLRLVLVEKQCIQGTKLKAASTYTLLPVGNGCASRGNGCASMRNGRIHQFVAHDIEESKNNLSEESGEQDTGATAPVSITLTDPASALSDANVPAAGGKPPRKPKAQPEAFPDPPPELIGQTGFSEAWTQFGVMRQRIRKPLTPYAAKLLLDKLGQRPADAVAAMHLSIENSWQGIEWNWLDNRQTGGSKADQGAGKKPIKDYFASNRNAGTLNEGMTSQYAGTVLTD